MLDRFGPEYALNAQGIYYRDEFRPEWVTANRKVWVPSLQSIDWESSSEQSRRWRAEIVLQHNINNERRMRSEYAWEADAWSDVFGHIRDDDLLEM